MWGASSLGGMFKRRTGDPYKDTGSLTGSIHRVGECNLAPLNLNLAQDLPRAKRRTQVRLPTRCAPVGARVLM